jgi:riboflavin kinase/FMN adenylyltransferase
MNNLKRVIALGFFDGVHNGHGALLHRVAERARELNAIDGVDQVRLLALE